MRIALLQLNPTVGDLQANAQRIAEAVERAAGLGAGLCVTSELAVTGYPPRDLLLYDDFLDRTERTAQGLAERLAGSIPVLAGLPLRMPELRERPGTRLSNAAVLLAEGRMGPSFAKTLLPTYDVFDETRYFTPASQSGVLELAGRRIGVTVCEDVWNDKDFGSHPCRYAQDPVQDLVSQGAEAIVNLSASPFTLGKQAVRERMLAGMAAKYKLPILYANQVGGNDDLLFDGRSFAMDAEGRICARGALFEEDMVLVDLDAMQPMAPGPGPSREEETWKALVTGTRDYVRKCGFSQVLLGLSGGIDSAVTACVAAEALGPDNVLGVLMPSPFSSRGSLDDSLALARNLGIATTTLPIEPVMRAFEATLAGPFSGLTPDVTEENVQARIRGNLLMAMSNKFGRLLLTTGNKSELSVGYCTIYGDMSGGLAVISDVPKTLVYALAGYLNDLKGEMVPQAIITKPPSAELRPDQTDQDSLPDYDLLDAILERYVQRRESAEQIKAAGYDPATVDRVVRLVKIAEFKRRQAAPGLKITDRAFGTGWRMPLAAVW